MKRFLLCAMMIAILSAGCSRGTEGSGETSRMKDTWTSPKLSMDLVGDRPIKTDQPFMLSIKNQSSQTYIVGNRLELEIKVEGEWRSYSERPHTAWTFEAYQIAPNQSHKISLTLDEHYEPLKEGEYRLVSYLYKEQERTPVAAAVYHFTWPQ